MEIMLPNLTVLAFERSGFRNISAALLDGQDCQTCLTWCDWQL